MGSANISLTLILALGSPSVQRHMAYIGTPAPLILPRTMAQVSLFPCPPRAWVQARASIVVCIVK